MQLTGTHINYYFICRRKLWLFANGIQMEQGNDLVYEGNLVHENSYMERSEKFEELEIGGVKIDYYDAKAKIIHEVKLSNKVEAAHEWQVKYYIYTLANAGIDGVTGVLEYPKLRKKKAIYLSERDVQEIELIRNRILLIIESSNIPVLEEKKICKRCAYHDFCFVAEIS